MTDPQDALRKTIVARIATRDSSIPSPTPEQLAETARLLGLVAEAADGTPDGETVKKMLAGLGQTGGKAPAAPEGGTAADAIGGGDVIVNVRRGDDEAGRVAHARRTIAGERALVAKATPWFMKTPEIAHDIVVRREQGRTPGGVPVYTEQRLDAPAAKAPAADGWLRKAGGRATETLGVARDIAGLASGAARSAASDIKDLGNLGKNIQTAAGAAQGRAMSKAAGFDVDMRYGTPAEAAVEYKDTDLGFGKGKVAPETLAPGDPGYAGEREAQRRVLQGR
jgi:hypothetical protein